MKEENPYMAMTRTCKKGCALYTVVFIVKAVLLDLTKYRL